ncbi:copper resistance protein CopC [Microtetraspora sp. NBRC 13810]|uniref:copper resistance CopC family protein n=1 Tax=Microtetraspora sp. NBRC 13810 TaxID=3030990 RepID=UPI00255343E9|nr:copper resistance protein CopC [Microtetraspora sp. NBRC 13810]
MVPRLLALVALSVVALSLFAAPLPAFAHGRLVVSTPADGGTLAEPVGALSLAFTEKPAPFAYFAVTAPSGARVDRRWSHGEPFRLDEPVREYQLVDGVWEPRLFHTGFPVRVPVAHWPEQGLYVARYQTVASDGEEVEGEVRFTYSGAVTSAPAGWRAPTDQPGPELLAAVGHARPTAAATAGVATGGTAEVAAEVTAGATQPAAEPAAGAAPSSGEGLSVWLVPALIVVGAAVMVARVARRPAGRPATAAAGRTAPAAGDTSPGAPVRRRAGHAPAAKRRRRRRR